MGKCRAHKDLQMYRKKKDHSNLFPPLPQEVSMFDLKDNRLQKVEGHKLTEKLFGTILFSSSPIFRIAAVPYISMLDHLKQLKFRIVRSVSSRGITFVKHFIATEFVLVSNR